MKNNRNIKNNTTHLGWNRAGGAAVSNGVKKMILISFLFLFLGLGVASHTLAASGDLAQVSPAQSGFVPLAPISGLTSVADKNSAANSANLAVFFNNLYKYAIGLAAVLAVIEIIWGGLEYSTQDNISKKSAGKQRIYDAIFGLVLVLSPALVFSIINPSIIELSLNLPKLDLSVPPTPVRSNTGATTTPTGDTTPAGAIDIKIDNTMYRLYKCVGNGNCSQADITCGNDPKHKSTTVSQIKIACVKDGEVLLEKGSPWWNTDNSYSCPSQTDIYLKCELK